MADEIRVVNSFELIGKLMTTYPQEYVPVQTVIDLINNMAQDADTLRGEAHWIYPTFTEDERTGSPFPAPYCSYCGTASLDHGTFCPGCGRRMV